MSRAAAAEQERSLNAISRALCSGGIAANANVSTTTYTYDANGNLVQAGGWNYAWDYLNRMLASGYNNSTTTYAYDQSGARVMQTSTTSTTYYPSKYFSLASTTVGGASYATSTNYLWLGDTLLATVDRKLYNGTATGTAITRYVHPDHLGSTNVVTDATGTIAQLLDYYPYGGTRVSSTTSPTNEKRQYIGQFSDAQTNLNYLNARYYDSARGQFTSEDPVFLGDPRQQNLLDPQSLNTYSYANDNPIVKSDPNGKFAAGAVPFIMYGAEGLGLGATVEFWGPPAVAGIITASTVALLSHGSGLVYAPSAPGFQQAVQLSQGSGYNPDPEPPFGKKPPPGRWGGAILTTITSAYLMKQATDIAEPYIKMSDWANQQRITQTYLNTWACSVPTGVNRTTYVENVTYSEQKNKPSYMGPTSSGTNPQYASQTYVTPNGAIVDWGGNVIVPAPSSKK